MHNNPLGHSLDQNNQDEHLDQRIVRALEAAPRLQIPADFAARVARQLPAKRPESLTPTHYGRWAMRIVTVLTLAALLLLALHSSDHATGRAAFGLIESVLFAQFIALAIWLSVWRQGLR